MESTSEQILMSRDLLSRRIMRPVLCALYQTRNLSNHVDLGSVGNVVFEDHYDFAKEFEGPRGKHYLRGQEDIKRGITGASYWSHGATDAGYNHIYAMGDVHGDFLSLLSAMYLAKVIDVDGRWIAKKTIFLQLGDLLDRQRPGMNKAQHTSYNPREEIDIIQYLFFIDREARKMGSRVVSITGNHDLWPYEGPASSVRKEYVGYPLKIYGSMRKRDMYFRSIGMRQYMAWYRPPVMKVNNWLAMHGGIHPNSLHRRMKELEEHGNDEQPIVWISQQWEQGILNPDQDFPTFIMDAMYNRYWATRPDEQDQEECSQHMMTMLRHFNIPRDGGLFMGHTPMWISKCGRRDSVEFNDIEVVCNSHCTTAACGGVLIDVAASEGFHEPLRSKKPQDILDHKKEDVRSTSVAHVNVRKNTLERIRTDHIRVNRKGGMERAHVRVVEQFNGKTWVVRKKESLTKNLVRVMMSYDGLCE